ncbi:MAG: sodium:proton antiporter, partial [Oligoflexia bacterium]|nr:sodium:proton antiporter [Oligoflexia bacterium]
MRLSVIIAVVLGVICWFWGASIGGHGHSEIAPPVYSVLPFIGILLSIAVIPLINGHWWHHNFPRVSLVIGLPMAVWALAINWHWLYHTGIEYVAFIVLLGSLFTISGGILIRGTIVGSTLVNCVFLAIGTVLASFIGTTGAAMLLIRPLIRANRFRNNKTHIIIFFIFLVANIGGSLTPLGDPPLFLGFLQGVDFFWTFKLTPVWAFTSVLLIVLFAIIDSIFMKKETKPSRDNAKEPLGISGSINFVFL